MKDNRYITESVSNIRDLMGRMGETLIMEGVVLPSDVVGTSVKEPIEGFTNGINVIVNTAMGKVVKQYHEIYINYDITGASREGFIQAFIALQKDLEINRCRKYNRGKNDITCKTLSGSGDIHLTQTIRVLNDDEIKRAHSIYNTMNAASGGNINMSWEDVKTQITISGRTNLINTNSIEGQGLLKGLLAKAAKLWKDAKAAVKGMLGKEPEITDNEGNTVQAVLDPKVTYGHQLSSLNKALIITQAEEYGVPTPQFVCKAEMITGKRPYGFERKFKDGIEIHPYYIRAINNRLASIPTLMKQFNHEDQAKIKENPQIAFEVAIENGDHGSGFLNTTTNFMWVVYYDIAETEPVNPEEDVFAETYGSMNNLDHIANNKVKQLGGNDIEGGKVELDTDTNLPEIGNETQDMSLTTSPFVEKVNVIKRIADEMGMPKAYKNVNLSDLPRKLRYIVQNLCILTISKMNPRFGQQECLTHASFARDMVLDALEAGQRKMNSTISDEVAQAAAQEIIAHIPINGEPSSEVGLVGEGFLGKCLSNAIIG